MRLPEKYRRSKDVGIEVEYTHEECTGRGRRLSVKFCNYRGKLGWLYHCWSCQNLPGGLRGFHPATDLPSPTETLRTVEEALRIQKIECLTNPEIDLPLDFTYNLDSKSLKYLMKYGINKKEAKRNRIGYSPTMDRMILPVYREDGKLIYWQARKIDKPYTKKTPKYLNLSAYNRKHVYYIHRANGTSVVNQSNEQEDSDRLVIVEAYVSAIKVGRQFDTMALLGAVLHPHAVNECKDKQVYIWLDPDKFKEAVTMAQRLRTVFNIRAVMINSPKKPKDYTDDEIKRYIVGTGG